VIVSNVNSQMTLGLQASPGRPVWRDVLNRGLQLLRYYVDPSNRRSVISLERVRRPRYRYKLRSSGAAAAFSRWRQPAVCGITHLRVAEQRQSKIKHRKKSQRLLTDRVLRTSVSNEVTSSPHSDELDASWNAIVFPERHGLWGGHAASP
jgi:hypothetical protein